MNYNIIKFLCFLFLIFGFFSSTGGVLWSVDAQAEEREIKSLGNITVYYYPENEALVDKVFRLIQGCIRDLNTQLGFEHDLVVDLYIPRSRDEFEKYLSGERKKWTSAFAVPAQSVGTIPWCPTRDTIMIDPSSIDLYSNPLLSTLKHELLHLFIGDIERKTSRKIPLWFNEGLAQWISGTPVFSDRSELRINALKGTLIPFEALTESFPETESKARLAYQQSESVVEFIVRDFGQEALQEVIRGLKQGKDFESALVNTLGLTPGQLEIRWQAKLKPFWSAIIIIITSRTTLFIIMAMLVLIGFFIIRRRSRRRLEEMEKEDEWMRSLDRSEWCSGSSNEWDNSASDSTNAE